MASRGARASERSVSQRLVVPDYSRLRAYEATEAELAPFGVDTVSDLVAYLNRYFVESGHFPVTWSDYPSTKRAFGRLLLRFHRLEKAARERVA